MERSDEERRSDAVRRFAEMYRVFGPTGVALAVGLLVGGVAFRSDNPVIVASGAALMGTQVVRWALVRTDDQLYTWGIAQTYATGAVVVTASIFTGGLWSPIAVFVVANGAIATAIFPSQRRWVWYGPALLACIGAGSLLTERPADAWWLAPVCLAAVAISVPRYVLAFVDIELRYRSKATLDPLTGCLNRASLARRLDELERRAAGRTESVAVIMLDVDHFKQVNDRHGHATGDEVLTALSNLISASIRSTDVLFRVGGEEFLVLLPDTDVTTATDVGERIRARVESAEFTVGAVTISLGVAAAVAPPSIEALIDGADSALLGAKEAGRNRLVRAA